MLLLTFHWVLKIKVEDKYQKVPKSSVKDIVHSLLNEIIHCYYFCKRNNSAYYINFIDRDGTLPRLFQEGM